jgi:hypothetical protein
MVSELTREYCQRFGLLSIRLSQAPGVADGAAAVCDIAVDFLDGYRVQFKLPAADTPAAEGVVELEADGRVRVGNGLPAPDEAVLRRFFRRIESRLEKVRHEQSVQNVAYLGNTFILNNKTVFDVVADEDGKLTIEMHRGGERRTAMLLASALLDGLYDGSIVQAR